ncbi:uracil-DNA glycosylase family protein [Sphingorhabdus sp. EL138]|uniref:uracil-DNA glycosylase family protein n=1 Tax=Sphingorhabdus sp. EL138 TaxID=2073156 RepID=UPI000D68A62C|nr:uracil-DNA glycosylase family protein [Sphingorhabdus sp. EL138]
MNFSASAPDENTSAEQIESLRDWWSLAGVDLHYNDKPSALLGDTAPAIKLAEPKPVAPTAPTESKPDLAKAKPPTERVSDNYPSEHDEFVAWLSRPENLIEAQWSQNHVLPSGVIEPEIMVIVGMPEQGNLEENSHFSQKSAALLANMLRAIECDSDKIYSASISLVRSYDGRIDPQYHEPLKKRMLHHIELVKPKRIIAFGESSSHLFFSENLLTARKNKQFVNHGSAKTEAIATFHPRILIERPEFKAEAWKDLQLLTRISSR